MNWRAQLLFEHAWDEDGACCRCGVGDTGRYDFTMQQWAEHVDSLLPWQQEVRQRTAIDNARQGWYGHPMTNQEITSLTDALREIRGLKYRLKQLGKDLGRAGRTIFELRNEVSALREAAVRPPGDYKRLLEQKRDVERENRLLREKLEHVEVPHVHVAVEEDHVAAGDQESHPE